MKLLLLSALCLVAQTNWKDNNLFKSSLIMLHQEHAANAEAGFATEKICQGHSKKLVGCKNCPAGKAQPDLGGKMRLPSTPTPPACATTGPPPTSTTPGTAGRKDQWTSNKDAADATLKAGHGESFSTTEQCEKCNDALGCGTVKEGKDGSKHCTNPNRNTCTCERGVAQTGADCLSNDNDCKTCANGEAPIASPIWIPREGRFAKMCPGACKCDHGAPFTGTECVSNAGKDATPKPIQDCKTCTDGNAPVCGTVDLSELNLPHTHNKDGSLSSVSEVAEVTPELVANRGAAMPILEDRDERGEGQIWCDPIAPSAGRLLSHSVVKVHSKEVELHWRTGSTTELIVDVRNTNTSNPSQATPSDM